MANNTPEDFIMGALIGSAIGIAAAMILTPFSGESLRKKIAKRFESAAPPTKKALSTRGQSSQMTAHKMKHVASKTSGKVASATKKRRTHS